MTEDGNSTSYSNHYGIQIIILKFFLAGIWSNFVVPSSINPKMFQDLLNKCEILLKQWGRNKFGNIPRRLTSIQDHISHLRAANASQIDNVLVKSLESQLDNLIELNETYWKQRSRLTGWQEEIETPSSFITRLRTEDVLTEFVEFSILVRGGLSILLRYHQFSSAITSNYSLPLHHCSKILIL